LTGQVDKEYPLVMIKAVITDFSRVLLFPKDKTYGGGLNSLNKQLLENNPHYNFQEYFDLNDELFTYFSEINKKIPVHIFTSGIIQENPSIKNIINDCSTTVISALKLEVHKSEQLAYEKLLEMLALKPHEVAYIDDMQANIDAASSLGINVILHTSNQGTIYQLSKLIES
jgi:FMN phosphatase YigB (HAD superfamily)